ncbi:BREX-1 system adenine-specific DNA-methyltransferase PglX [Nostoc sp. ATCC 53789]|uniref:BREX-1 system adenine-specific DNA-methyltransferase PglX n=1 Tax=Nostoc sp. ATCC 53789 TaxID=76335 RepID=UPI000DECDFEA|nr:BREX-1 system adenine-specific DNA-methyltransferase PglX [Nostoc sp. ATCC 53789]QHG20798.1 BREX-1 system adenine-specific DNA-methyltransferase PglX [Nostoc sp. ATCC 53789]RCJ25229.1 restriction endonuclease [Nostoc sp. ATCC 53789]
MNRTAIKNFAIWARRYLREQVKARAAQYGITDKSIIQSQPVTGGLLVAGQTLNATEANHYEQLRNRLQDLTLTSSQPQAVDALIDEIAYTWFNRLAALRFMEVNGYIGRVLSSSDPNLVDPDLLRDASSIAEMGDLPGLDLDTLNQWRSFANHDPNPDEFLYRRLLLAQCKALAEGIPALFDPRQNYQALFLPGNLLNQDSIVRRLVKEIPEEDWQNIEVVGWLYQFYISERKDEVIGAKSKVAAADIPAATQLFTPHWIVRYMVENSLGRLWLESHPESRLREYMPYYLENQEPLPNPLLEGEGTREENSCSPPRVGEGLGERSLTPQELTVIDPACGSGHILVYAFDLLFEIYKEQGYLERDIPALILTHNLYGLDIDERAAQLASFAVLMKARAKNSRILRKSLVLNITAVRPTHSQTLPPATELNAEDWKPLIEAFNNADNLGSLITPPAFDREKLKWQLDNLEASDSLFREFVPALQGLLLQAEFLRNKYWVVVANPPYMGGGSFNDVVKKFVNNNYIAGKGDLYTCYILKNIDLCIDHGSLAMLTIPNWMFLSSFEDLRKFILETTFLESLVHNGRGVFGSDFGSCSFVIRKKVYQDGLGVFKRLFDKQGSVASNEELEQRYFNTSNFDTKPADFAKIPGSAIAYWLSEKLLNIFENAESLGNVFESKQGLSTANNDRFLRLWFEVDLNNFGFGLCSREEAKKSKKRWFPYNKGGEFRKWYGNQEFVINWNNDGEEINNFKPKAVIRNPSYYFKPSVTWSLVSSSYFGVRYSGKGFIFDSAGSSAFCQSDMIFSLTGFLCSNVTSKLIQAINPTLNFSSGNVAVLPWISEKANIIKPKINSIVENCINTYRQDWDNFETSWDFQTHPLLRHNTKHLSEAFTIWQSKSETAFRELQQLEEENNRYWIEAYGLQDELTPEVPDDQITIRRADLNKDIRSLISYAVGCIMGRYSLDKPGLIHAGQPFDPTLHQTLSASSDAIIPITDQAYFDNDIVTRFIEFLRVAYSPETLTENLNFIANALILKNGESAQERIRRYFLQEFISDHIQTYKKRPIYWLFTSGKKRAFGALLYLHRYSEDALARIRTDYVLELQVKLDGEIARAQQQLDNTTSSAAKKAATNRLKELQAQQLELRDYQAKLQTQADARINLDLDDGVAYNYTRFKGLVYEGADLKIADLEKAAQWKLEFLK